MKKIILFFLLSLACSSLYARSSFDENTIKAELKLTGVKLVAVDFYTIGCPPCNDAIPIWKKLKKEYGDAIKVIVVVSQQNNGSCTIPDWQPDKIICDKNMKIAKSWGIKDFPQTFLWSWHNNDPLVKFGGIKDIEKAIKKYFQNIPRVALETDNNNQHLARLVEEALITNSKIEVVSNRYDRQKLMAIKKKSHQLKYNESLKCELGKEISANSILSITKQENTLSLRLSSAEKGCTIAATTKIMSGKNNEKADVTNAVQDLLSQLFGNISITGSDKKTAESAKSESKNAAKIFQDNRDCEYARKESSVTAWKTYVNKHSDGKCLNEAKGNIDKLSCIEAERESTVESWKKYLKEFPDGYCELKAKDNIKKIEDKKRDIKNEKLKQQDWYDCKYASNASSITAWKNYLSKHSDGECVEEAKENIDKLSCIEAERESTIQAWKKYLKEFPDGYCELKARDNITKIEEEKNQERYYEEERQLKNVYSRVDERMESIFTGEYNIGIVGVFDGKNKFGFSTGLDLNFNVYRKNFGHGAGHLFTGLGFDFEYYIPTPLAKYSEHLLEIPIMANLGYYFRTNNYTLRYVGLWSSLGAGIDIFLWKSSSNDDKIKNDIYSSLAWEIGFNMIFRNSFTANFGFGGFAGKAYKNTNGIHFFSNIGWIL